MIDKVRIICNKMLEHCNDDLNDKATLKNILKFAVVELNKIEEELE